MGRRSKPLAPGRPRRADVVVAVLFTVATATSLAVETATGGSALVWDAGGTWWAVSAVLVSVSLAWRRRRPLVPFVVLHAAMTSDVPDGSPLILLLAVALCVIVASTVLHAPPRALVWAAAIHVGATAAGVALLEETFGWEDVVGVAVPAAVGAAVRWARHRRRRRELAVQRRDWEDERRAVEQERVRMARELHDVVAHHVSGIVVSGGAALRILDRDPDAVRETLRTIAESASRTTEAMHRMIMNGEDGADVAPGGGPDGAQPGLPDLQELVERFTRTGCSIELHRTGDLGTVPSDAGLSAYRIVQECLTNSLKHAGPVGVTVRVHRGDDQLVVRVDDAGPRADAPLAALHGTGQGLVGMAERVAIFGGTLVYGPRLGGGWSVHASLPLGRPAAG